MRPKQEKESSESSAKIPEGGAAESSAKIPEGGAAESSAKIPEGGAAASPEPCQTNVGSPGKVAIYRISHNSVSLRWTPPAGEVKNYIVTFREGRQIVKLETTNTNISVTDLKPGTFYTFTVSAEFADGNISEPTVTHAYTGATTLRDVAFYRIQRRLLAVCWTGPAEGATKYHIVCRNNNTKKRLTTTDTNITVSKLEPGTYYTMELSAEFADGSISEVTSVCAYTGEPQ